MQPSAYVGPGDDPEPPPTAPFHIRQAWRDRDLARRKAYHAKIREARRNEYREANRVANMGPAMFLLTNTGPAATAPPSPPPQPAHGTADGTSYHPTATPPPEPPAASAPLADDTPLTPDDYRRAIARIVRTPGVRAADVLKALELDAKLTARMGAVIDDSRELTTMPQPGSPEWSGSLQLIMQAQQSQIAAAVRAARERRAAAENTAAPPD